MRTKLYLGIKAQGDKALREIFRSEREPTFKTHGKIYNACVGPFRTIKGAQFMRDYGQGNPHCRCVEDAERLAKAL